MVFKQYILFMLFVASVFFIARHYIIAVYAMAVVCTSYLNMLGLFHILGSAPIFMSSNNL